MTLSSKYQIKKFPNSDSWTWHTFGIIKTLNFKILTKIYLFRNGNLFSNGLHHNLIKFSFKLNQDTNVGWYRFFFIVYVLAFQMFIITFNSWVQIKILEVCSFYSTHFPFVYGCILYVFVWEFVLFLLTHVIQWLYFKQILKISS